MKKIVLAILLACSFPLSSQTTPYTVQISWQPASDGSDAGGTINVYKAIGFCGSASQQFTQIATDVSLDGPYLDSSVTSGSYCYYVTAVVNSDESGPSPTTSVSIKPGPVTNFKVTVTVK